MVDLKLIVYEMSQNSISAIGMLQEYISLQYTPKFDEVGSFSLVIPFTKEAFDLVMRQNDCEKLISLEDGFIGICHKVSVKNTPKKRQIQIKGQLAEGLLENNAAPALTILPSSSASNPPDIQDLISTYISDSTTSLSTGTWWSGIQFTRNTQQGLDFTLPDGVQVDPGTSRSFVEALSKASNKGYSVKLKNDGQFNKLELTLQGFVDRTVTQSSVDPVLISAKVGELYSSEFVINSQNWKNVVYAYGSYTDINNQKIDVNQTVIYDEYSSIADIPIQQIRATYTPVEIFFESGTAPTLQDAQDIVYREGKKKLYEYALVKSYECKIQEKDSAFKFGIDYNLGDKLTLFDEDLGLQLDAQLLEYTKTFDKNGENFEPVFGFSQPTLNRILKQKGVI